MIKFKTPTDILRRLNLTTYSSLQTLLESIEQNNVRFVDCTSYTLPIFNDRDARKEFDKLRLPRAIYFDIEECKDFSFPYPHMLPQKHQFKSYMRKLLNENYENTEFILYDALGTFFSPRVAWMFECFEIKNYSILNGGLPCWNKQRLPVETEPSFQSDLSEPIPYNHSKDQPLDGVATYSQVNKIIEQRSVGPCSHVLLDMRPEGRVKGVMPEPREEIPSGCVPTAFNVPFSDLLHQTTYNRDVTTMPYKAGTMLQSIQSALPCENTFEYPYYEIKTDIEELQAVFEKRGVDLNDHTTYTLMCGSGLTACIAYYALRVVNIHVDKLKVYDGSYTEWKTRKINDS